MAEPSAIPDLNLTIHQINASKYFQLAAFVMLIWDHFISFDEEVERIWKRRTSGLTILFLLNRYITPLQFIIIVTAFHHPQWTNEVCARFVAFEGASTVAMIAICQMVMILRIYALYAQNKMVLVGLGIVWAAQIIISSVGITLGFVAPLPPGYTGCIFTSSHRFFPALWVAPLITDSIIFLMTVLRTNDYRSLIRGTPTLHIFVRDGAAYFLIIFLANLMNTLIYFLAPGAVKAIGASFSQLITATMVSRLVLNLRSLSASAEHFDEDYAHDTLDHRAPPNTPLHERSFLTRTVNDLGHRDRRRTHTNTVLQFADPDLTRTASTDVAMEDMSGQGKSSG
ncbi:hypothetical protein BKA70DRAFT_733652 [Coprinopsis sp. MPI-PUGE-AT-0042]|nr:hypothetical protein BKA70DRAFT_733652 [Coprinopsis sp. MPI-PUGE-AT-0042]